MPRGVQIDTYGAARADVFVAYQRMGLHGVKHWASVQEALRRVRNKHSSRGLSSHGTFSTFLVSSSDTCNVQLEGKFGPGIGWQRQWRRGYIICQILFFSFFLDTMVVQ
jgi:hypothetical protein